MGTVKTANFACSKKIEDLWGSLALSDPHFCKLSRDCFNLSREYFSLWTRNASALLDPGNIFTRRS